MNSTNLKTDDINLLIVSYLTGSIDKNDLTKLTRWINTTEENRRYFNSLKDAWILSSSLTLDLAGSLEESWGTFKNRLSPESEDGKISRRKVILKYLKIAATWLAFFALGSVVTYLFTGRPSGLPSNPVTITVPRGAKSNITLPDGTNVWLNAGTTINYNQNYGQKERRLQLTGEAYFDVARDRLHPFIVQTSDIIVKAIGTRFNVKAYPDEKTISATLEEGKIDVLLMNKNGRNENVMLKPNEKIVYFKELRESETYTESVEDKHRQDVKADETNALKLENASILTHVQTKLFTSWKDPRWIIEREPLVTLAPLLERRFNLQIVFGDDELKKYKFTGTIENETVDQILNAMRLTAPLDYRINKDTIKLTVNNKLKNEFGKIMTRKNTN
jgi:transmembrane sensor